MRKFLVALCSVLMLYAFVPSGSLSVSSPAVIAGSAGDATDQAHARRRAAAAGQRAAAAVAGPAAAIGVPKREPTHGVAGSPAQPPPSGQRSSRPRAIATTGLHATSITGGTRRKQSQHQPRPERQPQPERQSRCEPRRQSRRQPRHRPRHRHRLERLGRGRVLGGRGGGGSDSRGGRLDRLFAAAGVRHGGDGRHHLPAVRRRRYAPRYQGSDVVYVVVDDPTIGGTMNNPSERGGRHTSPEPGEKLKGKEYERELASCTSSSSSSRNGRSRPARRFASCSKDATAPAKAERSRRSRSGSARASFA